MESYKKEKGMTKEWSIRPYEEGDEKGIYKLWKIVYSESESDWDRWMKWWHWLYMENPAGTGLIQIAEVDGEVVGHAAHIPVMMKFRFMPVLTRLYNETSAACAIQGQYTY